MDYTIQHGTIIDGTGDCQGQLARRFGGQFHGYPGTWPLRLIDKIEVQRVLEI